MQQTITIREVGPRGIQSLGAFNDTPRKVELREALSDICSKPTQASASSLR